MPLFHVVRTKFWKLFSKLYTKSAHTNSSYIFQLLQQLHFSTLTNNNSYILRLSDLEETLSATQKELSKIQDCNKKLNNDLHEVFKCFVISKCRYSI